MKSHIVPRFISKWLKDTSATGFLVTPQEPAERIQDTEKFSLLCHDCEEKLSNFERYFANEIFFPFHNQRIKSFKYDYHLELFIISLSWRILKMGNDKFKLEHRDLQLYVDKAEKDWREILIGHKQIIDPYENHLFFWDYTKNNAKNTPAFNWYNLRGIDVTLAANDKIVFIYIKIPRMIFVTSIYPTTIKNWYRTRIKKNGFITTEQLIDPSFWEFFKTRVDITDKVSNIPSPELSMKRLQKAMEKNPQKVLNSDTLQIIMIIKNQKRKEKMKDMPNTIISLVENVLLISTDNREINTKNQNLRWNIQIIADSLSNLSKKEIEKLDKSIIESINKSKILQIDTYCRLETNSLWITFMINRKATKEYQQKQIRIEIEKLKKKQKIVKTNIVVFAMNSDDKCSFETGFIVWPMRISKTRNNSA